MRKLHFSSIFPWIHFGRNRVSLPESSHDDLPLREFVYLDEVSLSSLLASKKGEQIENVISEAGEAALAEVSGNIRAGAGIGASAELGSRFQTSNSSALQTTRKANAQSLFRDFYAIESLRKIDVAGPINTVSSEAELIRLANGASCYEASTLSRGDLVEFKVRLSASWIFQMSTMVAEFADIFDQSPHLFINNIKVSDLFEAKDAQKVLSKLLADLIPIEGTASHYGVLRRGGKDYIVHEDAIEGLNVEVEALQIVGVTDHLAYWKDIRRILFSDNEFTMLCRVSKPGLQASWNPIKVADIFAQFAPDLAREIEVTSKAALAQANQSKATAIVGPSAMTLALKRYARLLVEKSADTKGAEERVAARIEENAFQDGSAAGQREAFAQVRQWVEDEANCDLDPDADLEIRDRVRADFDLSVFNIDANPIVEQVEGPSVELETDDLRLLEVEVVAIYW